MVPGLISVFTKVPGSFCLRLQLLPLERLHRATKLQPRLCADSGLCESLWELQPGPEFSIWSPFLGRDANKQIFLHRYANSPKKRAPFSIASVLLLGFRWLKKPELCVRKAAGTGVVPKCLCLGICKAINVSFFLLQLLETPIFSIDFTQNAYCP